jgi:hypothetical protein
MGGCTAPSVLTLLVVETGTPSTFSVRGPRWCSGCSRVPPQIVRAASVCGTLYVSFPVLAIPSRKSASAAPVTLPEKEKSMKDKNLKACIDYLKSLQRRDGIGPEQREAVARALEKLMKLRRNPNPKRQEVFLAVREVTEAIVKNFLK